MSVLLETSLGTLVIDLYLEERPKCSLNFLKLCQMKQYNFCLFHEVQKNLVAQTGDPTGTGRGGSSIFEHLYGEQARYFDAEKKPKISHARRGLVSMVDNGYGQHGSQFFITLADHLEYLDKKHTVFGQVAEGLDFVDRINEVFCDKENRPYRNVRIHHTIVLDDPFPTPEGLDFPASPSRIPVNRFLDSGVPRLEEDEELDDQSGLSPSKLAELKEEQEARTHAQLLTLIGDLPDADVKPPENVLFVCRLNPVTNSEDLEIIFSRFGPIRSCEVIRDRSTGASLQYAFIEFEKEEDCENAFFKMDKVVIDDRRIHVDFSQSVAKEWQKYRQHNRPEKTKAHSVRPDSDHPPTNPHTHRNRPPARRRSRSPLPVSRQHQRRRSPVKDSRTRQRSESPEIPERFRRKDPPGPDLDLIVSDSDESNSSRAKHRHRKHRHHRESDKGSANRKHHKSKHKKEHSRHHHRS